MMQKSEPWYIHAVLYLIIAVLVFVLIQVAIIEPIEISEQENYYKTETRLRMTNLREAQILWEKKHGQYTDNLDSLITFLKTDSTIQMVMTGIDTITNRSTNPFDSLSHGFFTPDSLKWSPRSYLPFIVQVDTSVEVDTVINRTGRITRIDSTVTIGTRYVIKSPDNKDQIGDLFSDALKNTASWE